MRARFVRKQAMFLSDLDEIDLVPERDLGSDQRQ